VIGWEIVSEMIYSVSSGGHQMLQVLWSLWRISVPDEKNWLAAALAVGVVKEYGGLWLKISHSHNCW